MKGIYIPTPVCGPRYVDRWLSYTLPTLLAPDNLPALAKHYKLKLLLCSTHEDLQRILASPLLKAARDVMGVRVVPMAQNMAELAEKIRFHAQKFNLMNLCHNYGAELAWQDDHGLICGLGDAIYTNGSFAEIARHIETGKRAVITQGLDVTQDRFDALLDAYGVRRDDVALTIPPRTFAQIAARSLHPVHQSMIWTADRFTYHPSVLHWPLDGHGVLLRGFHLFPVFIYPDRKAQIKTTIDGDFIVDALSDFDDCAFIHDSDQFFFAGISDETKIDFIPTIPRRADPIAVAQWMAGNTKPFQRELYIQQKIWLHDGTDRQAWRAVEDESDRVVADILQSHQLLTAHPALA
jgi:hypothetical protein